jgi:hypothetical protein
MFRALIAASAAWGAVACNAILGIEEPLQRPFPDIDAEPDRGGMADVSNGDAGDDDPTTVDVAAADAEAAVPDAPPETGPADDVSSDAMEDADSDASDDAFDDGPDPGDAPDGDAGPRDGSDARPDADAGRAGDVRTDPRLDARRIDALFPPI